MDVGLFRDSRALMREYNVLLTSASGLEVGATVAELEARVVAVARLVRGILDDGVYGRLLDDARRVATGTAELGFEAASRVDGGRRGHGQRQEDGDGGGGGGVTSRGVRRTQHDTVGTIVHGRIVR